MRFAYFHIIHNFLFFFFFFFIRHSCVAVVGRECGQRQRTELGAVDDDVDDAIVVLILLITLVNENKGEGKKKRVKQGGGGRGMLIDAGLG